MWFPVGIEDFAELRRNGYYFVDKTSFIQEFLDKRPKVLLMTRPRRFGKTLFMSMISYFFSQDDAKENRKLFRGLAIDRAGEKYMCEQGSRPVVFLTLKEWKADNWAGMQEVIRNALGNLFDQYHFLLDDSKLSQRDRRILHLLIDGEADITQEMTSLAFLVRLLAQHYGKNPVLLLDEYDVPAQQGWEHDYYDKAIGFLRGFLAAALKTNPFLDFAILTGVLRIAKESIFSGLNNLIISSVSEESYPTAFGFTSDEVHSLAEAAGRKDSLAELQKWYDGYHFAGYDIYNPWSVLNYFDRGSIARPYWANTSGNQILVYLLQQTGREQQENLVKLLRGESITAIIDEGIVYQDIEKNADALYTVMLETGYLTINHQQWSPMGEECELSIPNEEVRSIYSREILQHISGNEPLSILGRLMRSLMQGHASEFQENLSQVLLRMTSVYDTANKESFYHGFLLGMTALLMPAYDVQSNRESGKGRFDVAIYPKSEEQYGAILEFKTADKEDELSMRADEALKQIESRDYVESFASRGIDDSRIWKYGIAFSGKNVVVKSAKGPSATKWLI